MTTYYHGSSKVFDRFDLAHALEGDGKVKFGYGVYVTSHYRTAAHYSGANPSATRFYVYSVEIPEKTEDNYIAFQQPVQPSVVQRAEAKLGTVIPEKQTLDGKVDLAGEKAAAKFLLDIGVEFIEWPYHWKNPALGTNRAVLDDGKVRIPCIIDTYQAYGQTVYFKSGDRYGLWQWVIDELLEPVYDEIEVLDIDEPTLFTLNGEKGYVKAEGHDFIPVSLEKTMDALLNGHILTDILYPMRRGLSIERMRQRKNDCSIAFPPGM